MLLDANETESPKFRSEKKRNRGRLEPTLAGSSANFFFSCRLATKLDQVIALSSLVERSLKCFVIKRADNLQFYPVMSSRRARSSDVQLTSSTSYCFSCTLDLGVSQPLTVRGIFRCSRKKTLRKKLGFVLPSKTDPIIPKLFPLAICFDPKKELETFERNFRFLVLVVKPVVCERRSVNDKKRPSL